MTILGLHHITLVTTHAKRCVDFYTRTLGLHLVKRTVNFDDPSAHHLYFGDATGSPGSAITFFEWPRAARGAPGIGGTHHFALAVADMDALLMWKRRLGDLGVRVTGPFDQRAFTSIAFNDPDGTIVEIATLGPGKTRDEADDPPAEMTVAHREDARGSATTWPEPVPDITPRMALTRGMRHITAVSANLDRTHAFFAGLLGMRLIGQTSRVDNPASRQFTWGAGDGQPGTLVSYIERDPRNEPRVRMGAGQTHHFALAVADEDAQMAWRERLLSAGLSVSPVMDRIYFKSIYTKDPDGHIVELATVPPGFAADEPGDALGRALKLPPWLEPHREAIEGSLSPIYP